MKENNKNPILNSRSKSIAKSLYTFFVIALPSLLIWILFSTDFPFAEKFNLNFDWWIKLLISIAFVVGTLLITLLFIYLKLLDFSILMFSLPVSICFMAIFLSNGLVAWARAIIIIPVILLVIPICMILKKIELKMLIKKRARFEKSNESIVGHKK